MGFSNRFIPTDAAQLHASFDIYEADLRAPRYVIPSSRMRFVKTLLVPISTVPPSGASQTSRAPVRVNIVQDVSGSMFGARIDACKVGIKSLCDVLEPQDKIGVLEFGNIVTVSRLAIKILSKKTEKKELVEDEFRSMTRLFLLTCKHTIQQRYLDLTDHP